MSTHPRDEFDEAAARREIVGAHRRPRGVVRRVLPWAAVLLLAPLAAWLLFTFGLRGQIPVATEALQGVGARATERSGATAREVSTPGAADAGTPDPGSVDRGTAVTILDGTEDGGGREVRDALEAAGYTAVTLGAYSAADPAGSTVYQRSGSVADTATDVARVVSDARAVPGRPARVAVLESASAASSAPVVVVLR